MAKETLNIGFMGLGQMGQPMAERLLGDDVRLHVFDPSHTAVKQLVDAGAVAHSSPLSVANAASVVMACLPNRRVSEAVALGSDGIINGTAVRVYVEMSTIGRECIASIARNLSARGIRTVDAPVSGGPAVARAGNLAMLVAGSPGDVAEVTPWLMRIGGSVHNMGQQLGLAQTMKLINNLIMATNVLVAAEGIVMGAKAGLEPGAMMELLNKGSGGSFASSVILARSALVGHFHFGATLSIIAKDVDLGVKEAGDLGAWMPVIAKASSLWQEAAADGMADEDFTAIVRRIEERTGAVMRSSGRAS